MKEHIMLWLFLPEFYNPDEKGIALKVEEKKFITTLDEMALNLDGAGTVWRNWKDSGSVMIKDLIGVWYCKDKRYLDEMRILEFIIADTPEKREWICDYTEKTLITRFKQKAIYLLFIPHVEPILIVKKMIT